MSNYLFLFTIGPVQGFIAQARKTRDLAAGSQILSELAKAGIQAAEDAGATSVFPHWKTSSDLPQSIPNRFLVKFNDIAESDLGAVGEKIQAAVETKWNEMAKDTLENLGLSLDKTKAEFQRKWKNQVKDQWQIFWAFENIKNDNYANAHDAVERLVGSIKNTRTFGQIDNEQRRKCSVSGERDALIFGNSVFDYQKFNVEYTEIELINKNDVQMDDKEGLSASVVIKRFYQKESPFPSTAEIASMDFMHEIQSTPVADFFDKCYKPMFKPSSWDYQLIYSENLTEKYFEKQRVKIDGKVSESYNSHFKDHLAAQNALRDFYGKAKAANIERKPSPYYALLMFDADNMGKWLSGVFLAVNQRQEFHTAFAKALQNFAKEATKAVDMANTPIGKTAYAGGDDYLGFINLNALFPALSMLRSLFDTHVNGDMELSKFLNGKTMSFSAGIAIAHYKTPLREVLDAARAAEHTAKHFSDAKDAFCIRVLKRSGEQQECVMPFGAKEGEKSYANLETLKRITEGLQKEEFSNTYIKSLEAEISGLAGRDKASLGIANVIVKPEINRLVARAHDSKKDKTLIEPMQKAVCSLWDEAGTKKTIDNFLHALHIADFLHRQPDKN